MGPLTIIVVVELMLSAGILGLSSYPQVLNSAKHQISNVLGVQQIAQVDDTSTTPATDSSNNTPTTTSDQSNSGSPSTNQTGSDSSLSPTAVPLFDQEINPSPSSEIIETSPAPTAEASGTHLSGEQANPSTSPKPSGELTPTLTPTPSEESEVQTQAVLNPEELINSPDNINSESLAEAKKEDDQIEKTTDPQEQTKLLINFATDKVKDMSNFMKSDDFTSTNFAAIRFSDQIDKAISNLDKLPPKGQTATEKQLTNFCNQADQVLRTVELSVPEELEQDIQMTRGQCQKLNL